MQKNTLLSCLFTAAVLAAAPLISYSQMRRDVMELTTSSFTPGGIIPDKYTCKGTNISPALSWSSIPAGTRSLALIVEDPDAPRGTYTHWLAYNIMTDTRGLPEGLPVGSTSSALEQGQNDFGVAGYGGPCPPAGHGPHRYFFKLFALDSTLQIPAGAKRAAVDAALNGHIIDHAEIMGRYEVRE